MYFARDREKKYLTQQQLSQLTAKGAHSATGGGTYTHTHIHTYTATRIMPDGSNNNRNIC